jgi:hypothetical protein
MLNDVHFRVVNWMSVDLAGYKAAPEKELGRRTDCQRRIRPRQ